MQTSKDQMETARGMSLERRWFSIVFYGAMGVFTFLVVFFHRDNLTQMLVLLAILLSLTLLYAFWAVRYFRSGTLFQRYLFSVVLIAATFVSVIAWQPMANLQFLAYPYLWVQSQSIREGIVWSVLLAVAAFVGQLFHPGQTQESLGLLLVLAAVSIVFSAVMGAWFSHLYDTRETIATLGRTTATLEEREHLSREIHDTIAQDFTSLVLLAQRGSVELSSGKGALSETLALIEEVAREGLADARYLVSSRSSEKLVSEGLSAALNRAVLRFSRENPGIVVHSRIEPGDGLDQETQVVVLRCLQESLANIRKHSRASRVDIMVEYDPSTHFTIFQVADNGIGFANSARGEGTEGFGLLGLKERVNLAGGDFQVTSHLGSGTRVKASVPLASNSDRAVES